MESTRFRNRVNSTSWYRGAGFQKPCPGYFHEPTDTNSGSTMGLPGHCSSAG